MQSAAGSASMSGKASSRGYVELRGGSTHQVYWHEPSSQHCCAPSLRLLKTMAVRQGMH